VSEVAVPGRTAHEGKPASQHRERAFAPSPSGRCGHARSVAVLARSTAPSASAATARGVRVLRRRSERSALAVRRQGDPATGRTRWNRCSAPVLNSYAAQVFDRGRPTWTFSDPLSNRRIEPRVIEVHGIRLTDHQWHHRVHPCLDLRRHVLAFVHLACRHGNSSWRTSRPDIFEIVGVDFGDGQFTYAAYFKGGHQRWCPCLGSSSGTRARRAW
jgi:hypothetical protein